MTSPHQSRPGNARNGQRHAHPTCWVTDTHEYALVTRADWHPVIWRRSIGGGAWSSYDLSGTVVGLVDVTDSHHAVAMGVDHLDRVWIAGNVHADPHKVIYSAPGSITSWSTWSAPSWLAAHSVVSTYHSMDVFSDGQLIWSFDGNTSGGLGRDWCLLRMNLTTGEWEPCVSDGRVMRVDDVGDPGGGNDLLPDRSYLYGMHVDSDDVVHVVGVWRIDESDMASMTDSFYCRSSNRGTAWESVTGAAVPAPFLIGTTLPVAGITMGGNPVGHSTLGSLLVVPIGGESVPVWTGWNADDWYFVCAYEGGDWGVASLGMPLGDVPSLAWHHDALLYVYRDTTTGMLVAGPTTDGSGSRATLGAVNIGTPDGSYTYESGACYWPAPVHVSADPLFMVPDQDSPSLRRLGVRVDLQGVV